MSISEVDKKIREVIGTIKKAIYPELNIPKDHENDPINYRIIRIKDLLNEIDEKSEALSATLSNVKTNLGALLEELNPPAEPVTLSDESSKKEPDVESEPEKPKTKKSQKKSTEKTTKKESKK